MTLPAMTFVSCIYDNIDDDELPATDDPQTALISINVGILGDSRTRAASDDEVGEDGALINSLRIVITDDKGNVEINEKVQIDQPKKEEHLLFLVGVGMKKVFLIGNAENTSLLVPSETPEAAQNTTLGDLMQQYPAGTPGFEEAINSVYFINTIAEAFGVQTIPLTSVYTIEALAGGKQEFKFWLVRAATKYTVHFTNKRQETLYLRDLTISSLETQMFLMPQVVGQQTINGIYWIDWLRQISEESENHLGEPDWNGTAGWITDYLVPPFSEKYIFTPVHSVQNDERYKIAGSTSEPGTSVVTPGTLDLGPFYSTEGKNPAAGAAQNGFQSYILGLKLYDIADNKEVDLERTLPTLSALFRNTHVIIYVEFDEAWMHIYGEIGDWETNDVFGDVTEEK